MPHTNFWFDQSQARDCKDPGQAIAWLQDTRSRTYLSDYWAGFAIPSNIDLQGQALLMMGTTGELQTALRQDIANGISGLVLRRANSTAIWFVRRRAGRDTKTVVIIACAYDYWGGAYTDPGNGWRALQAGFLNGVLVQDLADRIVPSAKGVSAWW